MRARPDPASLAPHVQVVGNKYETFLARRMELGEEGDSRNAEKAMNELGLKRYCCRRMILTHCDLIDKLLAYGTLNREAAPSARR